MCIYRNMTLQLNVWQFCGESQFEAERDFQDLDD